MNRDILNDSNYNFLQQNPDLSNVIYLALSGSYGYGTNSQNSDIDLRGFLIESPKYLFGIDHFDQFEDRQTDTVIYGLKKFVFLCTKANPNALEILGVDEDCIMIETEFGKMIRNNSDLFLSKRVINSFGNYANAQLRRLQNALCHDSYDSKDKNEHLAKTLNSQIHHFNENFSSLDDDAIKIFIDSEDNLLFNVHLENYPVSDFVGIYSEMANTVKTYSKLNHRNRKKDDYKLNKHAMHLIRLLLMGIDILKGNGIITKRTKEHDLLMNIKNGKITYDEVFSLADQLQKEFNSFAKTTKLPKIPDIKKIESIMADIYLRSADTT